MATDTSIVGDIAERYGLALYELADEAKCLDVVAGDLADLKHLIVDSEALAKLLRKRRLPWLQLKSGRSGKPPIWRA